MEEKNILDIQDLVDEADNFKAIEEEIIKSQIINLQLDEEITEEQIHVQAIKLVELEERFAQAEENYRIIMEQLEELKVKINQESIGEGE